MESSDSGAEVDLQSCDVVEQELLNLVEKEARQDVQEKGENKTPDPTVETEVCIAAVQEELSALLPKRSSVSVLRGSEGSDQGRGSSLSIRESPVLGKSPTTHCEILDGTNFRLKLGGLISTPGSGRVSRKDSGCSTPLSMSVRSEQLEYPCLNFVQSVTPAGVREMDPNIDEHMTIKCHYNPIMDEYISLSEPAYQEDTSDEMNTMFELYKTEQAFNSSRVPTLNIGTFLKEFQNLGIRREDPRIKKFIQNLQIVLKERGEEISLDSLDIDKRTFLRCVEEDYEFISRVLKNQLIIPEFNEFCEVIRSIYMECKDIDSGSVASYIPQLATYSPQYWGVSVCTVDGQRFSIGETDIEFSLQSASKPFTYAICLNELGSEIVHKYVGQEPSGRMFNELSLDFNNKPHNPLLNSGAIMSAAILLKLVKPEMAISEKFDLVWNYFREIAGHEHIGFNNSIFLSERETADRNFALAYYMKENKCFPTGFNLQDSLDFYFQTCSMEVNCDSLSVLGATLANGGTCPTTEKSVLRPEVVRDVLSLMHSCGMYNYSGQFAFKVGIPAKSGVSGALVLVIPNVMGIGLWSPPLDGLGNTVRGGSFAEKFSERFIFHQFDNIVHLTSKADPRKHKYDVKKEVVMSLLYSATTGDLTALRRLKLQNVDMGVKDYDQRTPLHLAAAEGHVDCVKFLVEECAARVNVKDRWGFTPLDEGRRFKHQKVVQYLLQHQQKLLHHNLEEALSSIEDPRSRKIEARMKKHSAN